MADYGICQTCRGAIALAPVMRPPEWDAHPPKPCVCDTTQYMEDLLSFGYSHAPEVRSFGGPFMMRRPDGSIVSEEEFGTEINRLLNA